jgi:uncharacterized protein YcaQ
LWPGRRWQGRAGVRQAIQAGAVVQMDPLSVLARSHDIALYGRVLDYRPVDLEAVLYEERAAFDYGGTLFVHPMEELPFWRPIMERRGREPRWQEYADRNRPLVELVRGEVRRRGPTFARDLGDLAGEVAHFRSGRAAGLALYALWLTGELMTHSRRGTEKRFDLTERVAPSHLRHAVSQEEAESFFALRVFRERGLMTGRAYRNVFAGAIERKVTPEEAAGRLAALVDDGLVAPVRLASEPKTPAYVSSDQLPLLEAVAAGGVPEEWRPLEEESSHEEAVILAPLEIVSARGRARRLFDFEYVWEVYKPRAKRRYGYYTVPILLGDRLVARLDGRMERSSRTLVVNGYWPEPGAPAGPAHLASLGRGLRRFMAFLGADDLRNDSDASHIRMALAEAAVGA